MTIELAETQETEEIEEPTPIEEEEKPKEQPTGEEDTETITVEDIVSGKLPEKKGIDKTPKWAKDRFDELTAKIYEKDRKIKELEAERVVSAGRPEIPLESDFADPQEYKKARIKYEDDLDIWKARDRRNAEFEENLIREREDNLIKFQKNSERMKQKFEDFDTVVNEPIFTPEMRDEITASDYGPEIGYFLGKNPNEVIRLGRLSPKGLAKEIGKLEFKFSQATSKLVSGAPPPIKPLKGDDVVEKDPSKMTDDEWFKWDKQQRIKKIQGK